jgi:vacuolar-type H+-ATPase subunit E/Vma4
MEIAEEEIERTAQEAVKAAMLEVGGELAYEKERADQLEKAKEALELENKKLKEEAQKKQNQFFYGALIGGAGGVVITSLVFSLIMGVCK